MKKILIEIGHPAHVHQFKNMYWELEKKGWKGLFVTKDKECAIDLLKSYNLPHEILGVTKKGIASKILSLPYFAIKMFKVAISFKPDVFVSRVSPLSGWSSFLLRKPHITFTDTENVKLLDSISEPFADVILTSTAYMRDHGKRQIRYPGYHELAYLHPNRFKANRDVYNKLGLEDGERYAIVRFVSWSAHHDMGHKGLTPENKSRLVKELSKHMKVLVSSEGDLIPELRRYLISIPPQDIHDALAFAQLFVGESATMASECAMLGTPALYLNSQRFGCTNEQSEFGVLEQFNEDNDGQNAIIERAAEIAADVNIKKRFDTLSGRLIGAKIDVSSFMVWFVQHFLVNGLAVKNRINWNSFREHL
jgi:predicted glycosyltransferase